MYFLNIFNKFFIEDVCTNELAEDIVRKPVHSFLPQFTGKGLLNEVHFLC